MFRIYAAFRKILAVSPNDITLGYVANDAIESFIIPGMRVRMERVSPEEAEEIQAQIEEWQDYANPRSRNGQVFNKIAAQVMTSFQRSFGASDYDAEDVSQKLAENLYKRKRHLVKKHFSQFMRKTPSDMVKFWPRFITLQAKTIWRTYLTERGRIQRELPSEEREDGDEDSLVERLEDPKVSLETILERDLIEEMTRFVVPKIRSNERMMALYRTFISKILQRAEKVTMARDVYPELIEEFGTKVSQWNRMWSDLRKIIADFFKKELNVTLPQSVKRKLNIASADFLTMETLRRRLAAWVLSGIA